MGQFQILEKVQLQYLLFIDNNNKKNIPGLPFTFCWTKPVGIELKIIVVVI